jgi:hypothetical protein
MIRDYEYDNADFGNAFQNQFKRSLGLPGEPMGGPMGRGGAFDGGDPNAWRGGQALGDLNPPGVKLNPANPTPFQLPGEMPIGNHFLGGPVAFEPRPMGGSTGDEGSYLGGGGAQPMLSNPQNKMVPLRGPRGGYQPPTPMRGPIGGQSNATLRGPQGGYQPPIPLRGPKGGYQPPPPVANPQTAFQFQPSPQPQAWNWGDMSNIYRRRF